MHFNEWIMCLRLLWKPEHHRTDSLLRPKGTTDETIDKKEEGSDEMDEALALFSQHHHEIVHKHPTFHSMLIALSTGSRCMSHMITVGRWLNQSQSIGNPGHLAGVLPRCFCRQPMLATTLRAGFEPEELYVCRVRRSGEGGCARVIRVQDVMLSAYTSISKTPTRPTVATTTTTTPTSTPAPERKVRPTSKPQEQDLLEAMSLSAPDVWESIESKCKSEWKPLPNTFADGVSSWAGVDLLGDDNWAGLISWIVPREVPTCTFRPASRPAWIFSGAFGQLKSHNKNSSKMVVKGGAGNNKGKGKGALSLEEYIDQHEWALKPRTVEIDTKMHTIRTASEVFEDSITRLDQRIKVMQLEGLDNPRFECRQCHDGALDHAIVPCYHLVMCDKCIDVSKECVKCHGPIDGVRRVYWG
ncbi:hypothetical protein BGZ74_009633 [Mortierella antarctica]|nr:hypothetical protein BGZ74_009633 [Mortierella antarctica]